MKALFVLFLSAFLSLPAVSQTGLDSIYAHYFPDIRPSDPLEKTVAALLQDTSRFEARDTFGGFCFRYKDYSLIKNTEAFIYLDLPDTVSEHPFDPNVSVGINFGDKDSCEYYFKRAIADFSKQLKAEKRKKEKHEPLGHSVNYEFYDKSGKKVLTIAMLWPFDLDPYYTLFIEVYK